MSAKAVVRDKAGNIQKFFGVRIYDDGDLFYRGPKGELSYTPVLYLYEQAVQIQRAWGGSVISEEKIDEVEDLH